MMKLPFDFLIQFNGESTAGLGEDSWCYGFGDTAGLIGVFDGCGGAGSLCHDAYDNHTEAFMASRFCAGIFYEFAQRYLFDSAISFSHLVENVLPEMISQRFADNFPPQDGIIIRSSMLRTLPTTAAAVMIRALSQAEHEVCSVWAGDSRVYVLDENGLSQLTIDDSKQPDPFEDLYDDGSLTGLVCANKPVNLHHRIVRLKPPFLLLSATDGCFAYYPTPMDFEGVLLRTLLNADTPEQWERKLESQIRRVAGDDHTLCLAAFGYGSFDALKRSFTERYRCLEKIYLKPLHELELMDRDARRILWKQYSHNYMRYIERD